jgi:hypothetical protein
MAKKNELELVLKTMPMVGECEVDVDKAVKIWNDSFSVSQFKEQYSLVKFYRDGDYGKVTISKKQAHELIGKLNLVDEQSAIFRSGRTWRKQSTQTA